MKILFVGQAPSKKTEGKPAFSGASGKRLATIMRLEHDEMLRRYEFVNLLGFYPGPGGTSYPRGDHFPRDQARHAAESVVKLNKLSRYDRVVLLGNNVKQAFRLDDFPYLEWCDSSEIHRWLAVCPHPSGVNHWWNEKHNVQKAMKFFRDLQFQEEVAATRWAA